MHSTYSTNSVLCLNILCFALVYNHNTALTVAQDLGKPVNNVLPFIFFRVVHGFTSSGMLESQYQGFAEAAKLGNVGDKYKEYGTI